MNAFEEFAEAAIVSPVKRKAAAADRRRATREARAEAERTAEKELEEQAILLKGWRRWRAEKRDALLAGPHGKEVRGLISFMRTMTLSSAPGLIRLVEEATWVRDLPANERADLLSIISRGISRLRERNGLTPFDDALPGEPESAFHRIMEIVK